MTLQEICKQLGKSEVTLITSFKRTQMNLLKKGIILTKEGKGKDANYEVSFKNDKNEQND